MLHYHGTPITPRERLYVMLDNGAFSFWKVGRETNWPAYYEWAEPWLDYPTTWAVIPDVIDGNEDQNNDLIDEWRDQGLPRGVPVWHLHESLFRLRFLTHSFERVCFGSSGQYADLGTDQWHRRVSEAFDTICDERGRVPWVHMLRGLAFAGSHYPFASADSTNAARNHAGSWRRDPTPIRVLADRSDRLQCPARWERVGTQLEVTA